MTTSATITVRLPRRTLQSVDEIATQKNLSRDDALVEIIEDYTRRQATHQRIQQNMRRKWDSPQWQKSVENIERLRAKAKTAREAELKADIRAAIHGVRVETKKPSGKNR